MPSTRVMTVATASMAPAAPRQWPIMDLFDRREQLVGVLAEGVLEGARLGDVSG